MNNRELPVDASDATIDEIWAQEAENRLRAYRQGRLKAVAMDELFKPKDKDPNLDAPTPR
jgi:hypothetical protein